MRQAILALFVVAIPRAVLACAVCFGQSDSPLAKATNMGIFLMLGVVAVVLACFASFFIYLGRRARLAAGSQPNTAIGGSHPDPRNHAWGQTGV